MKKLFFITVFSTMFATSALSANLTWTPVGGNTVVGSNGVSYTQSGNIIRNNNSGETYNTLNGTTLGSGGQNYQTFDGGSYRTTRDINSGRSCTDWGSSVGVVCN